MRPGWQAGSSSGSGPLFARSAPYRVARWLQPPQASMAPSRSITKYVRSATSCVSTPNTWRVTASACSCTVKPRAQHHAGTGDQRIHGGHVGRQRHAQAGQGAKAEPGTRDTSLLHLICRHQFLRGNTVWRVAMDDFMVDHQLAASDAVEQLRLRLAGGESGRETGADLRATLGQQGSRVLELLCVIGIDGQQGRHIVGIVGVQLGLDHRRREKCVYRWQAPCVYLLWNGWKVAKGNIVAPVAAQFTAIITRFVARSIFRRHQSIAQSQQE